MPAKDSHGKWFEQAQKLWAPLAQAALWILGIIAGFLLPPPVGVEADGVWVKFAQFVIAFCVGLLLLPSRLWRRKKHAKWWWIVAVVTFAMAIGSFFAYQRLTYRSTCVTYQGKQVVIGNILTPHGEEYTRDNPGISCTDLLDDHGNDRLDIWTKESIDSARLKLGATYIACVPLFTLCIMSLIQAIYCASRKQR